MRIAHDDMRTDITVSEVSQMVEEFDYFSDCLLTEADPHPDGEHSRVDIATVQAVHKSVESGDWVSL
jgi:xylose dehydrogenase (NAD/NADP)